MEQNSKYIEGLLEKFFEGLTSNIEEQEIYNYFLKENEIPAHLEKYRAMLHYFEVDMESELEVMFSEKDDAIVGVGEKNRNNRLLRKWIIGISAVAASLLLLFLVSPFASSEDFNPYEGSYVKKDGVVIYDRAEIEAEQARIELLIEQKLACVDEPFLRAEEKLEEYRTLENEMEQIAN